MKNVVVFVVGALLCGAGSICADVLLAYWDFGPDDVGYTETVSIENVEGVPSLSGMSNGDGYDPNGQEGNAFVDLEGTSHDAGQALAWGSGVNDGTQEWILGVDLSGYQNIAIQWDYRSTGTGPSGATLDYKTGEGAWTTIEEIALLTDSSYHTYQKDLSLFTDINNESTVQFRLSGFTGGTGSGTHRIDNLQLSAIPEPAVMGFIALSGIGCLIGRRFVVF